MTDNKLDSEAMFEDLVKNGLDFLRHSVSQLERNPKYSVISFYSAVEIFLKARLMLEHWTLVLARPDQADIVRFKDGDFVSINLEEAAVRLQKVVGYKLDKDELDCFNGLRKHRNKLVHFFHAAQLKKPSKKALIEVVAEQCRGWYYLHRLLRKTWALEFSKLSMEIRELDELMHTHKKYLQAKFDAIVPEISILRDQGHKISICPSCNLEARIAHDEGHSLFYLKCRVCYAGSNALNLECPTCRKEFTFYSDEGGLCKACDEKVDVQLLFDHYGGLQSPKEKATEPDPEYCTYCGALSGPTVIPWDDEYLCLSCLALHDTVEQCEWCSERIAGELKASYASGCPLCDGRLGYEND